MTFDPPNDDAELVDIPAPEGTFLDWAPVHLVTSGTLAACAAQRPDLDWNVRRFRPKLVVESGDIAPFEDQRWVGSIVRIGDVELAVTQPTVRCAIPPRAQPGLERQPRVFQAMTDLNVEFPNHLGVYCTVTRSGTVRVGDPVEVLS
jgi:hypothetical protein